MIRTAIFATTLLAAAAAHAATDTGTTARGEYLTHMADCAACHMGADGKLSGGRAFKTPFGTIHATNLTPDPVHGVGAYTDDEWVAALQQGIGRSGHLYPAMPYTSYTLMRREDALAIKAYILTLPTSQADTPANAMRFPFNIRGLMVFWNWMYNPNRRFADNADHDAAWNRGAYLAEALGHCQQCHTPRNFLQGLKSGRAYAGAVQQGWLAYNITSDSSSGLGGWSEHDLATYLQSGHADGHGAAAGPMAEAVGYSLRYLTPEDAGALAAYIKSVPAIATPSPPAATHVDEDALGQKIYAGACASCHRADGTGVQSAAAALAGDHTASDPAATNLLQVLLQGTRLDTPDGALAMPSFGQAYTDAELAALANYTVEHFAQRPAAVTPERIAKLRPAA
jgi:mono/diheme cytochrome c family protein